MQDGFDCTFDIDYDGYEWPCILDRELNCDECPWGEEHEEDDEDSECHDYELGDLSTWAGQNIPTLRDDICAIMLEGEDTIIGRQVTISRIQDILRYKEWLEEDNEDI